MKRLLKKDKIIAQSFENSGMIILCPLCGYSLKLDDDTATIKDSSKFVVPFENSPGIIVVCTSMQCGAKFKLPTKPIELEVYDEEGEQG